MNDVSDWWQGSRRVWILVDNPSWVLPYAEELCGQLVKNGDKAALCRAASEVGEGDVAFFLGCIKTAGPDVISRNRRNLVVHESDLPAGRGFSPVQWQILNGQNAIPICLFEAVGEPDSGPVIYRDTMTFEGHELSSEIRRQQGEKTVELCLRFMKEQAPPVGEPQSGEASAYPRRTGEDSRLDPERSIAEQFDLLRVVDNENFPAFFDCRGHRYKLLIEKHSPDDHDG